MKAFLSWHVTYAILVIVLFNISHISAQSDYPIQRQLITAQVQQQLEDSLVDLRPRRAAIEQYTDSIADVLTPTSLILPLAFHVLNPPSGHQLVKETQIFEQIEALNRDFNNEAYQIQHPADTREGFSDLVADMDITFCLAQYNIQGSFQQAIQYVSSTRADWPANQQLKQPSAGGVAPWDPQHLINIWIVPLKDGISGYAQMPGGPPETDGIVIDYRFFGKKDSSVTPYFQGKTLTHLMGNYLNLYDLWGQEKLCTDDFVSDTPIHNTPNSGCPDYKHVTTCGGNKVEMTMNFMDNTYDQCMYMFTKGQKMRVHALFTPNGSRAGLIQDKKTVCDRSNVFRLVAPETEIDTILPNQFDIYPNPTEEFAQLHIQSVISGSITIKIATARGNTIYTNRYEIWEGYQTFPISCKNWAKGIYYVQVAFPEETLVQKLIIH